VLLPFAGDFPSAHEPAVLASVATPAAAAQVGPFRIINPTDGSTIGDGNLMLLEAEAGDAAVDRVELSIGDGGTWMPAQRSSEQPNRWSQLWIDPTRGPHRIQARAFDANGQLMFQQTARVQVADVWSGPIVIDNPYQGAGSFHKGQLHAHSTNSFDGWQSLPPGHLALEYKRRGYHFIALTDHDVVSYPKEIEDSGFLVLPAFESTSDGGHITGVFAEQVVPPSMRAQARIDGIRDAGGLAVLNHPTWQIGWGAPDVNTLQGYLAIEIFNGKTTTSGSTERNLRMWTDALNARGYQQRIWGMGVDDAHAPGEIDRGWIVAKMPELSATALRRSLERGAFYASNGPSFGMLGILRGAITASSPDAATIRFVDHDLKVLGEGPATGAGYRPTGAERWVRVEAVDAEGRTAWSQPFWIIPNAPKAELAALEVGKAVTGETIPGARVHVSDNGQYLGSTVANAQGLYSFPMPNFAEGPHDYWVLATAPWPDQLNSPGMLLSYTGPGSTTSAERR